MAETRVGMEWYQTGQKQGTTGDLVACTPAGPRKLWELDAPFEGERGQGTGSWSLHPAVTPGDQRVPQMPYPALSLHARGASSEPLKCRIATCVVAWRTDKRNHQARIPPPCKKQGHTHGTRSERPKRQRRRCLPRSSMHARTLNAVSTSPLSRQAVESFQYCRQDRSGLRVDYRGRSVASVSR